MGQTAKAFDGVETSTTLPESCLTGEDLERDFGVRNQDAKLMEDPIPAGRRRVLLLACACILGNELCERLAYYGLQTNMGLYLKKVLGYPADTASQLLQVWKATVYLTPLIGAYLADAVMGRFWVILVFSIIYFIGMLGITLVNTIPSIKPTQGGPAPSAGIHTTMSMFWAFMYVTALGTGGIKPCVSSFGGDQFKENSARERSWRSSFFNWFYFCVNLGSLVATTVVVGVQENRGYGVGFAIPTIFFAAAILAFVLGAVFKLYNRIPPEGSPFTRVFRVFKGAFAKRKLPLPSDPRDLYEPLPGADGALPFQISHTDRMRYLDKAAIVSNQHVPVSRTEVEETKAFLGIMPLFLCICIYQMAYDPIFTLLPYPGDVMNRKLGAGPAEIPASSISFANTFGVLFMVVAYDLIIVRMANKLKRPISMTFRIGLGFVFLIIALVSAALIEMARYRVVRNAGLIDKFNAAGPDADPLDAAYVEPMSIWWQFIPYFLVGVSEVFCNIGTMELFYTQVSEGMRSIGTAVYLLSIAIGTYLASALNIIIASISPKDLWVADNPLFGHYDWYFWLNAVILTLGLGAYIWVARNYKEMTVQDIDKDPFNRETRVHSELGNVSRVWPSVSGESRLSDLQTRSSVTSGAGSGLRSRPGSLSVRRHDDDVGHSGYDILPHLGHAHQRPQSQTDQHETSSLLGPAGTGVDVEMAKLATNGTE